MTLHIGIDIGTSGVKAVLMDGVAKVLAEAARPIPVSIPHLGWSEQSADLWVEATFACRIRSAYRLSRRRASLDALLGLRQV